MRNYTLLGVFFIIFCFFNESLTATPPISGAKVENFNIPNYLSYELMGQKVEKIVIDAGHGGYDGGTSGAGSTEKDITLSIALQLGEAIGAQFPNLEIIYTRDSDVFVPLKERARIANDAHADLFISIHCNAMPAGPKGKKIHGSETYVLGSTKKSRNLAIAKRENAAVLQELADSYQGTNADSPQWHIFMSMYQQNYLEQSIEFAKKVEDKLKAITKRRSHGVLQNNFHVLREVAMPSVLIETGYLSNSSDEAYLLSKAGQKRTVKAIAEAFYEYKMNIDSGTAFFYVNAKPQKTKPAPPRPVIKRYKPTPTHKAIASTPTPKKQAKISKTTQKQVATQVQPPKTQYESVKPVTISDGPKIISVTEGQAFAETQTAPPTPAIRRKPKNKGLIIDHNSLVFSPVFKVQIGASKTPLNVKSKKYTQLSNLEVVYEDGYFKYLTGHSKRWSDISSLFKVLHNKGYNGFIVAYLNGKRIGLQEARNMVAK